MEELLRELVERLRKAYGGRLQSVVLYGSAASGDYHEKHSDLNVLCALERVGLTELELAAETLRWWSKRRQPAPLLLSCEELRDGADAFPIEFLDIKESYRVLYGADLVAPMEVSLANHRRQLEHELRSRLLRIRKRFLEVQHDHQAVGRLMLDSLPTFATFFRHALVAAGEKAPVRKAEIFQAAAARFQVGPAPFDSLLEVRAGRRKLAVADTRPWFAAYLEGITRLAEIVDEI